MIVRAEQHAAVDAVGVRRQVVLERVVLLDPGLEVVRVAWKGGAGRSERAITPTSLNANPTQPLGSLAVDVKRHIPRHGGSLRGFGLGPAAVSALRLQPYWMPIPRSPGITGRVLP